MKVSMKKKVIAILIVAAVLASAAFLLEHVFTESEMIVGRNPQGEGDKIVEYELSVDGELEKESFPIEVGEQEYTHEEIQKMFREVQEKLDKVILGENESFDRVEKNLNLVTELEGYPVRIQWQLDSYSVVNLFGEIQEKNLVEEGSLIELRGIISYMDEESVYVQHAMVYPLTRKGADKLLYEIRQKVEQTETDTRQEASLELPKEIDGKQLEWSRKKESTWQYILILGVALCVYLVYREHEKVKREEKQRKEELLRAYPGMISKFTMLLGTGTTVKNAWEKIVQNYEGQKEELGVQAVYEEMALALREMQGGVSEAEAYERFGKRCKVTVYVKFGTLLSQNLRKGSKGISEILRMEAIQSFENRKNHAKRLGEEAGTKLLMPMLGMLAVVFIIVMVPAFLSMQL